MPGCDRWREEDRDRCRPCRVFAENRVRWPLYRRARLLELRPRLAFGGHSFTLACEAEGRSPELWRCSGCLGLLPGWALAEGYEAALLGLWCPGLFAALPTSSPERLQTGESPGKVSP